MSVVTSDSIWAKKEQVHLLLSTRNYISKKPLNVLDSILWIKASTFCLFYLVSDI